jgi:cell division protease FtsH
MAEDKKDGTDGITSTYWRYVAVLIIATVLIYIWNAFFVTPVPEQYTINYSQFTEQLNAGNIKSVSIKKLLVSGEFQKEVGIQSPGEKNPAQVKYFQTFLPSFQGEGLLSQLREKNVIINIEPTEQGVFWQILLAILPWALIIGFWVLMMRRSQQLQGGPGGLFTFGASKAKLYDSKKPMVTFKDVAGMDKVKMELKETIEFLKDPSRFAKLGAKVPKGVLLVGPPGTGKTLLARATAGEAGVPFYSISASEFIEMFVGVGASRVRDMFKKAKDSHPSMIFIDEIDAEGRTRGTGREVPLLEASALDHYKGVRHGRR